MKTDKITIDYESKEKVGGGGCQENELYMSCGDREFNKWEHQENEKVSQGLVDRILGDLPPSK